MLKLNNDKKLVIRYNLFNRTDKMNNTLIKICKHFSFAGYIIKVPVINDKQRLIVLDLLSDLSVNSYLIQVMEDWGNMGEYMKESDYNKGSILLSSDSAELFTAGLNGYKAIKFAVKPRSTNDFFLRYYPKMYLSYYKDSKTNARKIKQLIR